MEVISLLHPIAHWLAALAGAGAWLWLIAMVVALLGWTMWVMHHLYGRVRSSIRLSAEFHRASRRASSADQSAPTLHDPIFRMLPRQ